MFDRILDQPVAIRGYPLPWITRNGNTIGGDYEIASVSCDVDLLDDVLKLDGVRWIGYI